MLALMEDKTVKRAEVEYVNASTVPTGATKHDVEAFAASLAKKWGRTPGIPVQETVKRLGGEVVYRDTDESPDGGYVVVHGKQDFGVVLSTWTSPRRDQFTLAHELGHYALHSKFGARPVFAARTGSGRSEWEANWFAASFLMPELEFKAAANENGASIHILAAKFGVSTAAVEIRKNSLGIV